MRVAAIVAICFVSFGVVQAQKANGNLVQIVALLQQHDEVEGWFTKF